ncbi:MAG: protein kinase domain-containing protein, partial [Mycobacteriales bacterium]
AGVIRDPRIAATYDTDEQEVSGRTAAYLVREWVAGESLRQLLSDGGLEPDRVAPLLQDAADALAALHAQGGWHGRLHPDNVLVQSDGRVRLTDPGTGTALAAAGLAQRDARGRPTHPPELPPWVIADLGLGARPDSPVDDPSVLRRRQRYDTCDLARTVYAAATGCWPGGPWRGMPEAPSDDGRTLAPRQVRAAVPRDLDAVVTSTLLPGRGRVAALQDAPSVAAALADVIPLPAEPADAPPERRRSRPWVWRALAVAGLVVIGAIGWSVGQSVGKVPGTTATVPSFTPAPGASGGAGAPGTAIPLKSVTAFDPPPGDGRENDDQIPLADDGSTATSWDTSTYTSAQLGNLKPGVGLLVDLGATTRVGSVQIVFDGAPTGVQLRAGDTRGATVAAFPLVTAQPQAGASATLAAGQTHRYWLVWITSLPKVSGGYRAGIAEMSFRS